MNKIYSLTKKRGIAHKNYLFWRETQGIPKNFMVSKIAESEEGILHLNKKSFNEFFGKNVVTCNAKVRLLK